MEDEMRRTLIVAGVLLFGIFAWTRAGAQQEMLSRPGPGSGITRAAQQGDWTVSVSSMPAVTIANGVHLRGPAFLRNRTYKVIWPNGDEERVTIITAPNVRATDRGSEPMPARSPELASDGWAEVQTSTGTRRWVNLMAARSVEEAR
jgi:hypothetical protein